MSKDLNSIIISDRDTISKYDHKMISLEVKIIVEYNHCYHSIAAYEVTMIS